MFCCGYGYGVTRLGGLDCHTETTENGIPPTARSPWGTSIIQRVYRIALPCSRSRITALPKTSASSSSASAIHPAFSRLLQSLSWIENRYLGTVHYKPSELFDSGQYCSFSRIHAS